MSENSSTSHNHSGSHHHSSSHSSHSSSHRHHHHRSSRSKTKRKRSSDRKAYLKTRYFFAFLLFVSLTVFSLSAAAKACPLNKSKVAEVLTNAEYVTGLYDDVRTYAEDMCQRNFVPESALDGVLTFERVNEINNAYVMGTLSLDERYSETVYRDRVSELSADLESSITATLEESGIKVAEGQKGGAKSLSNEIGSYLLERMTFPYMNKVKTALNLGTTATLAAMIVSGVITVAMILIVITMGSELYRNIRSLCHAFSASSLICFLMLGAYEIIKDAKQLYLFPTYLNDSIMRFLDSSVVAVTLTGAILAAVSFSTMALVWKLKSKALDS